MTHRTHCHTAPAAAFYVNSFILEGTASLVIIDSQFVLSQAEALRARALSLGKPVAALIITHPHPDHYNGAAALLRDLGPVPILATAATDAGMRQTAESKRAYWTPIVGADYPQQFVFPNRIIAHGETLRIDDITLVVDDLGAGECSDNVAFAAPQTGELFASDLIYSACHPWLAEGRSRQWLAQLDQAAARYTGIAQVHAGHGASGTLSLLAAQRDYIQTLADRITSTLPGGYDPGLAVTLAASWQAEHPGWQLDTLIGPNIEAMARELIAA